jgi:hypothetical protein
MSKSVSSPSVARAPKSTPRTSRGKSIAAPQFDALHDAGADLTEYLDADQAVRPGRAVQRVNVDFPVDLLRAIDREAKRIGVNRQAFIKLRIADSLAPRLGS